MKPQHWRALQGIFALGGAWNGILRDWVRERTMHHLTPPYQVRTPPNCRNALQRTCYDRGHHPCAECPAMTRSLLHCFIALLLATLLTACGSGAGGASSADNTASTLPPSTSSATASADISLLFMGNSHTSVNNLSGMVTAMVKAGLPNKTVAGMDAPGWMHLQERSTDPATLALLKSQRWSFVILQAQDYSQSGLYFYPTTGAEELVRQSRAASATPIMFPEWARRGINESQRIYDLHVSIAMKEPACVAPIPQRRSYYKAPRVWKARTIRGWAGSRDRRRTRAICRRGMGSSTCAIPSSGVARSRPHRP